MQTETFDIPAFCETYRVGRSTLYKLWQDGTGPAVMRVGRKVLISREASDEWRKRLEAASQDVREPAA